MGATRCSLRAARAAPLLLLQCCCCFGAGSEAGEMRAAAHFTPPPSLLPLVPPTHQLFVPSFFCALARFNFERHTQKGVVVGESEQERETACDKGVKRGWLMLLNAKATSAAKRFFSAARAGAMRCGGHAQSIKQRCNGGRQRTQGGKGPKREDAGVDKERVVVKRGSTNQNASQPRG